MIELIIGLFNGVVPVCGIRSMIYDVVHYKYLLHNCFNRYSDSVQKFGVE